jgi:hypothetical protein
MMDQPSFSAGRSLILGRHLFMLLLKNSETFDAFLDSNPDKYTNLEFHLTEHQKIEDYGCIDTAQKF